MMSKRTYLDYNATAPLRPQARAAMIAALDQVGNPSSVHHEGRRARAIVETAREQVARLVNCRPLEVVFTSGATEANAWVCGAGGWSTILLPGTEHDSVLGPAAATGARVHPIAVSPGGIVDLDAIEVQSRLAAERGGRTLLALQIANNETGVVQPIAAAAAIARAHGHFCHTDAVQGAGRLPIDFASSTVSSLSLSSHKLGGPSGVGALVVRDGARLANLISGGGQERRRRGGTENVIGIAGFGAAAEIAATQVSRMKQMADVRDRLEAALLAVTPDAVVVGRDTARLANTTCVARPGLAAETLVIKLDLAGIAVSAGAACSSGKVAASHVLTAMGLPTDVANGAIRLSIGWDTSDADIATLLKAWTEIARPRVMLAVA
jgi:cysteine desulfurase